MLAFDDVDGHHLRAWRIDFQILAADLKTFSGGADGRVAQAFDLAGITDTVGYL
jgi:hypothetical protein